MSLNLNLGIHMADFCKLILVFMGLSLFIGAHAEEVQTQGEQTTQDCTRLLDELKIRCMKENKKICEAIQDDIKQDRCMKNLEGNPTKIM